VNKLVIQGVPFRDAYKQVGSQINEGKYQPTMDINHTHEGSLGNLCLDQISLRMGKIIQTFDFQQVEKAYNKLLGLL
jgi:argininosuccinate lyase